MAGNLPREKMVSLDRGTEIGGSAGPEIVACSMWNMEYGVLCGCCCECDINNHFLSIIAAR